MGLASTLVSRAGPVGLGYAPWLVTLEPAQTAAAEEAELAALMARYAAGDAAAFEGLYAKVAPRVLGYLVRLLGERAAAEDALQLAFIRVHESRGGYVRGADPAPWIFTIAHRVALDELRRRRRARVRLAHEGERVPEPEVGLGGGAPEEAADPRGEIAIALLQRLPEPQRAALVLTKIEGRSLAEAAQITGSTVTALKLRAHRAYVKLRGLMEKVPT